jgi:uncharacterized protein (TIGR03437 family)
VATESSCGLHGSCTPIQIALETSSLATGTYNGIITIADSTALDAPQTITVTVNVGGNVPSALTFYLAPGGTASSSFTTGSAVKATVATNASWLTATSSTSPQGLTTVTITVTASSTMAASDYNGQVTIAGSSFSGDNKQISVLLHVTTEPIVQLSSSSVSFTIPQGTSKQTVPVLVTNAGQGTLTVSGVTATANNSGTWLSAAMVSGGITITADPTGLSNGDYQGTVTVASNADNASVTIPVDLMVVAQGPPVAFAGGVVNNGTFGNGEPLSQGDIAAVFGSQFTYDAPQGVTMLPLSTTLDNIQVLVNGKAAPLYFTSAGQINFEVPIDATTGDGTVQIVRNGMAGNMIYVNITARAPQFILYGAGTPVVTEADGFTLTGTASNPAKVGSTIVIYAVGLGPTTPPVATGTASPSSPNLATVPGVSQVCFGTVTPFSQAPCATPSFTGLTPGFAGLYQINVTIPSGVAVGNSTMSLLLIDNVESDSAPIALQ